MAKDSQGRFSATPDFVPQLKYEDYMNVQRGVVSFAADSSNPGVLVIPTQMTAAMGDTPGSVAGRKWVLFGASVQPLLPGDIPANAANQSLVRFQLCKGDQAALLSGQLPDVIAELKHSEGITTQGGTTTTWPKPLDIISPTPLVNAKLTFLQDTASNDAQFAAKNWLWKVYWGWADAQLGDYAAIVQMGMDLAAG